MASIWKQVLAPGTYHTRTGPVTFTPKHLAEFARNGQAMIAQQLPAVIPLEHQDDALPMTDGERLALQVSRNTGFVTAWRLAGDGTLWAKLSVDWLPDANGDSEIEHRLKNAIKYVSPQITPYLKDGTGKVWRNIISHVALTPTPVWHNQLPFGTDGPALSRGVIRLSLADRITKSMKTSTKRPRVTRAELVRRASAARQRQTVKLSAAELLDEEPLSLDQLRNRVSEAKEAMDRLTQRCALQPLTTLGASWMPSVRAALDNLLGIATNALERDLVAAGLPAATAVAMSRPSARPTDQQATNVMLELAGLRR